MEKMNYIVNNPMNLFTGTGILTMAFGKKIYVEQAKTLAHSLIFNMPELPRAIVTDSDDPILRVLFHHIIPFQPNFGSNVSQKLYIDVYSPFEETLFIDADCIVTRPLDEFMSLLKNFYFTVPGKRKLIISDTDPYIEDIPRFFKEFGIKSLPKFNGGIYWFRNCTEASNFFNLARNLLKDYRNLGFRDFHNTIGPNDEAIFATCMVLKNINMLEDEGRLMRTPVGMRGKLFIDSFGKGCKFNKNGINVYPAICHFSAQWSKTFEYNREAFKLALAYRLIMRFGKSIKPIIYLTGFCLDLVFSAKEMPLARKISNKLDKFFSLA